MVNNAVQVLLRSQVNDESFTQGMVSDALLLLLVEHHRLLYTIVDNSRAKAVVFREYLITSETADDAAYTEGFFEAVREEDEVLRNLIPQKVIVSFHSPRHTLIPDPLFSKTHLQEMLDLTSTPAFEARYFSDPLPSAQAQLVYAVPVSLLRETGDAYSQAQVFHASGAFIENELRLNKHEDQPIVSVMLRPGIFDLLITRGNELRFFNTFRYQSTEDFIYFLLFALEQQQLNPDQVWVRAYGEIEKISSMWMVSRKYIRNFSLGSSFESMGYAYGFERFSPHQYHNLFSQYLCVL